MEYSTQYLHTHVTAHAYLMNDMVKNSPFGFALIPNESSREVWIFSVGNFFVWGLQMISKKKNVFPSAQMLF